MVGTVNAERTARALEFGIYRDGDNNLDALRRQRSRRRCRSSEQEPRSISCRGHDGAARVSPHAHPAHRDIHDRRRRSSATSRWTTRTTWRDRDNLADFVARTLDAAEKTDAKQTWIDLIDHGGGDGGGLEADHGSGIMSADDIAGAIADGVAHARERPSRGCGTTHRRRRCQSMSNGDRSVSRTRSHKRGFAGWRQAPRRCLRPACRRRLPPTSHSTRTIRSTMARAVVQRTMDDALRDARRRPLRPGRSVRCSRPLANARSPR